MSRVVLLLLAVAHLASGCTMHIAPYTPKRRALDIGGDYAGAPSARGNSLYAGGRPLVEDDRPRREGDVLIIAVDEQDSASQDSTSKLSKKTKSSLGLSGGLIEALQKAVPAVQLAQLLGIDAQNGFDGAGSYRRQGRMTATLPVRVRKVLPNDDLFVEGTKVVMIGAEERHLYVSGIVRPVDIRSDGSVPSSRVADAEIEYTGRGDISDHQRPGWLTRTLNKVNPF
jgi:flagellar L-ring protein precursor FlgH